jgi:pyruvate formate lyase activating enzyme
MIKGWHKLSLIDYPEHLCTTIFFGGCNFRCFDCHNKDIAFTPEMIPDIEVDTILEYLDKRKGFVESVCISGGEPTIHQNLMELVENIKKRDYKVKIDTNGTRPEVLWQLIRYKLVDYIAMDVKAPKNKYTEVVRISQDKLDMNAVQESIHILKKDRVEYEFRTTVIPGLLDMQDVMGIGCWLSGARKYVLQPYKGKYGFIEEKDLKKYADLVSPHFKIVEVRC